jgi:RHS repeat-associated protein
MSARALLFAAAFAALPALSSAQVVEYYHLDALGSVRAVTNQAGAVIERHDYYAYGEECTAAPCSTTPAGTNTKKFTGKERDLESGLDYFGARYYGSRIGRFTSMDPLVPFAQGIADPQQWNRYSYARNNPSRYIDPDGRYSCSGSSCASFENERQTALQSSDAGVRRGAGAYGSPGDANGVTVSFGKPTLGGDGEASSELHMSESGAYSVTSDVIIRSGLSGIALRAAVGHEGTHVADAQDFVATMKGSSYTVGLNFTKFETEMNAYLVTQSVLSEVSKSASYGKCGKGNCILGQSTGQYMAPTVISVLLADPRNGYGVTLASPGPRLFSGLNGQ